MDIAWTAEAYEAPGGGTIYIATAPFAQQFAAIQLLTPKELAILDGSGEIQDVKGRRTRLSFVSMRGPVFECLAVTPAKARGGFKSVVLTRRFDAAASLEYTRRAAEALRTAQSREFPEAGFVGALGLPPETEQDFFRQVPRVPMPDSDFMAAVARAADRAIRWAPAGVQASGTGPG